MNTKAYEKIDTFKTLYKVMETNLEKWNHIEQLKYTYDEFVKNLKNLNELIPLSERDNSDLIRNLNESRAEVKTRLIPVINLLELYAIDKNKKSLKKRTLKIRDKIDKMDDNKVQKEVGDLCAFSEKHLGKENEKDIKNNKLESYGLSLKLIAELQSENLKFADHQKKLKEQEAAKKVALKEIPRRIKENDRLIRNRFHKFMSLYKNTDPDFYASYRMALENKKPVEKTEAKEQEKPKAAASKTSTGAAKTTASSNRRPRKKAVTKRASTSKSNTVTAANKKASSAKRGRTATNNKKK